VAGEVTLAGDGVIETRHAAGHCDGLPELWGEASLVRDLDAVCGGEDQVTSRSLALHVVGPDGGPRALEPVRVAQVVGGVGLHDGVTDERGWLGVDLALGTGFEHVVTFPEVVPAGTHVLVSYASPAQGNRAQVAVTVGEEPREVRFTPEEIPVPE